MDPAQAPDPDQLLRDSALLYRVLFETIDEGFCIVQVLFDAAGHARDYRFLEVNPAFTRQSGLSDVIGRTARELAPDHNPRWFEHYGRVAVTGEPVAFEEPAVTLGRRFQVHAFRVGRPEERRVAVLFNDIADRRRAETKLRESEERFRALVNATSDVVYRMSADWREMRQLDGRGFLSDTESPSVAWIDEYLFPEDQPAIHAAIQQAIAAKGVFQLEHRVRRADGSTGWTLSRAIPLLDAEGEIVEWFGAASDVTERRKAEQHLQLVVNELNHRVKNNLAMTLAISAQTFRSATDMTEAQALFAARINALAQANDLLTGQRGAGVSLRGVIEQTVQPHGGEAGRCEVDGPDLSLTPKMALSLSLAMHELATNALKYGAWSVAGGKVVLSWAVTPTDGGDRLRLEWRECGGPLVSPPKTRGFGSRLIERGLAAEMGGEVKILFEPEGVICRLDAPMNLYDED